MGRLHHRSGVPASPARRDDPLLHERVEGRGLRAPTDQGLDPTAARWPRFSGGTTRPRIMQGPEAPPFQALRRSMEDEWTPRLMETLGIDEMSLPVIWDADFLYGPRDAAGADTYVLCEINVSSCFAIPDDAPTAIARTVKDRTLQNQRAGSGS
ncbi:hypothetical protein [Bradyrhizobium genosp. P]|uniref:Cj0069 family protein n=1 Tax=Bradyrhizobium genosp. P TaxID=83641 RepID=UPI003CEA1088